MNNHDMNESGTGKSIPEGERDSASASLCAALEALLGEDGVCESQGEELRSAMAWEGSSKSEEELLDDLQRLPRRSTLSGDRIDYKAVRREILRASFELNRRQITAPAFRELRRSPPKSKSMASGDVLLSLDRQIIDLHWLYCAGWSGKVAGKPEFTSMF